MKTLAILILTFLVSCGTPHNICKKNIRISGEVIYAEKRGRQFRNVTIQNDTCRIKIYNVPIDQPLYNIPICKHKNRYYWVMP